MNRTLKSSLARPVNALDDATAPAESILDAAPPATREAGWDFAFEDVRKWMRGELLNAAKPSGGLAGQFDMSTFRDETLRSSMETLKGIVSHLGKAGKAAVKGFTPNKGATGKEGAFDFQYAGESAPLKNTGDTQKLRAAQASAPTTAVFQLPEVVRLATELLDGKYPKVMQYLSHNGLFIGGGSGEIRLSRDIFIGPMITSGAISSKEDMDGRTPEDVLEELKQSVLLEFGLREDEIRVRTEKSKRMKDTIEVTIFRRDESYAAKVLAHEVGHLIDYLPEGTLKRGNLLGRVAVLSRYLKGALTDQKGNTLLLKDIAAELKAVSAEWRPYDPARVGKEFHKYRQSSKELYADGISVLLNNPAMLREKAPKFFNALFEYMDRKPEAKKAYDDVVIAINSGNAMADRVSALREGFRQGEANFATTFLQRTTGKLKGWQKNAKTTFLDQFSVVKGLARKQRMAGKLDAEKDPEYSIDSAVYGASPVELMLDEMSRRIVEPLNRANVSWDDFGEYMYHHRVMGERAEMANPEGFSPSTSAERIREMEGASKENADALRKAREEFIALRREFAIPAIESAGYSPELIRHVKNNDSYVTFDVVKFFDETAGKTGSAKIYRQYGTLSKIANPATRTIMKDISIMRAALWNTAKRDTVGFLAEFHPEQIEEAESVFKNDHNEYIEPKDPKKGLLVFSDNGEMKGYYVDRYIADAFDRQPSERLQQWAMFARLTGAPFRMLFTGVNPGFWTFNLVRDYNRALKNLPNAGLWHGLPDFGILTLAPQYVKAVKPALKSAFGVPDAVVKQMLKDGMLISVADIGGLTSEDKQHERLLKMYVTKPGGWNGFVKRPFSTLFQSMLRIGEAMERVPKIAGDMYLKEKFPHMTARERAHYIRHRIGSPSFITRGTATPITNNLFLFSNAILQSWNSDIQAMQENPRQVAAKFMYYAVLPKVIMAGLATGAVYNLLKSAGLDDDDEEMKWLKLIQRMYADVSDFDKTNYTVIPLGVTPSGKTIYLRVPQDELQRFVGGAFWKFATGDKGLKEVPGMLSYAADQAPSLNPAVSIGRATIEYLGGRNPYDFFKGHEIVPETEFKAGGWTSHKEMLKWISNAAGLGIIHRFRTENTSEAETELEKFLDKPVVSNVLGRWLKVSDYGTTEILREVEEAEQSRRANETLVLRDIADKQARGEALTYEEEVTAKANEDYLRRRAKTAEARMTGNPYLERLAMASTVAERDAIQLKIREIEGEDFDLVPLIRDDIRTKMNTLASGSATVEEKQAVIEWLKARGVSYQEASDIAIESAYELRDWKDARKKERAIHEWLFELED
jgi:hypothetical protein